MVSAVRLWDTKSKSRIGWREQNWHTPIVSKLTSANKYQWGEKIDWLRWRKRVGLKAWNYLNFGQHPSRHGTVNPVVCDHFIVACVTGVCQFLRKLDLRLLLTIKKSDKLDCLLANGQLSKSLIFAIAAVLQVKFRLTVWHDNNSRHYFRSRTLNVKWTRNPYLYLWIEIITYG